MIPASTLLAFVPVAALLTITPGTDTMLVLRSATTGSARSATMAAFGIALGCLAWGLIVALGLGALLVARPGLFAALRLCGAVYLAWIGLGLLRRQHTDELVDTGNAGFRQGLLTNLLNPKVGVFYLTLLPQFLPANAGPTDGMALATIHVALSGVWFALLITLARRIAPMLASPRFARNLDRLCGTAFLGFSAKLALSRA